MKTVKGSSCPNNPEFARSAFRGRNDPDNRYSGIGFRLKLQTNQQKETQMNTNKISFEVNGAQFDFIELEGGTYMMGSPEDEPGRWSDEKQHEATVESFALGQFPVTQKQYEAVMGTNPSYFKGENLPVETVSWFDAIEFISKFNELLKEKGLDFEADLPTEEEWEYAYRAGTTTAYYTGDTITEKDACFNTNQTANVGSYPPNPWGLYDMAGNVWEWCKNDYQLYSDDESSE